MIDNPRCEQESLWLFSSQLTEYHFSLLCQVIAQGMGSWLSHPVLGFLHKYCWRYWFFFSDRCYPFPNGFNINSEGLAWVRTLYMRDVALAAEYRRITVIQKISHFYRICDGPSITVFDGRNIFPVLFTPFYVLLELRAAFTFFP